MPERKPLQLRGAKRVALWSVLLALAFGASCFGLLRPSMYLVDPLTHRQVESSGEPFPVLIVKDGKGHVAMVDDLVAMPPLAAGVSYLVPQGMEEALLDDINEHDRPVADSWWILHVTRITSDRQRIELFLMGDGYWGGVYEATPQTITPRYRKSTGPGFAFVIGACVLGLNITLWGMGIVCVRYYYVRRRRSPHKEPA